MIMLNTIVMEPNKITDGVDEAMADDRGVDGVVSFAEPLGDGASPEEDDDGDNGGDGGEFMGASLDSGGSRPIGPSVDGDNAGDIIGEDEVGENAGTGAVVGVMASAGDGEVEGEFDSDDGDPAGDEPGVAAPPGSGDPDGEVAPGIVEVGEPAGTGDVVGVSEPEGDGEMCDPDGELAPG